jgi:glycosyltransferase involved in cell wall biosynthesis
MPEGLRTLLARRMPADAAIEALFQPRMDTACDRRLFFVACFSEQDRPSGGHKMLYRHVDILNRNGINASILHVTPGFRYSWFENETRISYLSPGLIGLNDVLIIPETLGCMAASLAPGVKKVIYNQNCYYTFSNYPFSKEDMRNSYSDRSLVGVIVVSEDSKRYLQYSFPDLPIFRIRYCIDSHIFYPYWPKRRIISCMTRKGGELIRQLVNILKFRKVFARYDFELAVLDNCSEQEVSSTLRQSLIYLSTSEQEGFGLPAAEAMASGCLVVGFHGQGGQEFMLPEYAYPIPQGNVLEFAQTVESILSNYSIDPDSLLLKAERASSFIHRKYNGITEEEDVMAAWSAIRSRL